MSYKNIVVSIYLSVGGDIFVKLESAFQKNNRWDSLNLQLDTEGRSLSRQLLYGHVDRRCTSADYCPHFTKFPPVSTLVNIKRMCMKRHHKKTWYRGHRSEDILIYSKELSYKIGHCRTRFIYFILHDSSDNLDNYYYYQIKQ